METYLQNQAANELKKFLVSVGTPLEWLANTEELDLNDLFQRLRESGRISEDVYEQLNKALKTNKPTLKE
jgi:hypothetical protein